MRLAFSIAYRFLRSNKGQTTLILIGIIIGVAVQIFIGSLIDGLQISLVDKTIGNASQITILPSGKDKYFVEDKSMLDTLENNDNLTAISKAYDNSAFIKIGVDTYPILLRGVEFIDANMIYEFNEKLVEGSIPEKENETLIGSDLAVDNNLSVGDEIEILTPEGVNEKLKISGIFDLKVSNLNKTWIVMPINGARSIFGNDNQLTSIEMQVKDVFKADIIADEIEKDINKTTIDVLNWKEENEELLSGLSGQSASSIMIQVFVLLAVLLGISSVLAISVVQKSKQLGILKAMGIKDRQASYIFVFQGLILGILGAILGIIFGVLLTYVFSIFVKNPDGTALVPFYIDYAFIGVSALIAIVASTLAALIPARNTSKLNPIEVIKNG
ncbi:MAG TPA: ABC transporter permease [Soehngenia sp.]|nr:ABC transporter permease [Soehngenia sp.]